MSTSTKFRVLLADDHRIVREGIKQVINQLPNARVEGEFDNAEQLCRSAVSLRPDLILLDVSMPNSKCADTIRFLRRECPETKLLMLTMHSEIAYLNLCLEAGAAGYVLKASSQSDLVQAINTVLNGGVYIDPQLARQIAMQMQKTQNPDANSRKLSNRETEVLRLLSQGHTNREVAELVGLSDKSVETYKSRALEKLGLTSRNDLLRYAMAEGWLDNL